MRLENRDRGRTSGKFPGTKTGTEGLENSKAE